MSQFEVADFVWRQPTAGVFGRVHKKPEAGDPGEDGSDTFENEDLTTLVMLRIVTYRGELTHLHPSYPAVPSIFTICKYRISDNVSKISICTGSELAVGEILRTKKASNPEKAPAIALAVKKMAILVWLSCGIYHFEISKIAPGKKPALQGGTRLA